MLFGTFLVGWGMSFIGGPLARPLRPHKVLASTILMFAVFTALAATAQNVWTLERLSIPGRRRHRR